jgi:DNA invertase Pin-like site-specific DNA recombinase
MRKTAPSTPQARPRTLGYACVYANGSELESQRRAIESACEQLDLELADFVHDADPEESDPNGRPGLLRTLERIDGGEAACLIVNDLMHLSREVGPFAAVLDRIERGGARLVALNVGLDTATEAGRLATARRPGAQLDEAPVAPAEILPAEAAPEEAEPAEAAPAEAATAEAAPEEAAPAEAAPTPAEPVDTAPPAPAPEPSAPPPPSAPPAEPAVRAAVRAYGYASVPADAENTGELEEQKAAISGLCRRLGIELVEVICEREPRTGKALDRAGLSFLIERIAGGDGTCIVVSGLERLSRSVAELGTIVRWLERNEVRLVAIDIDLDTASPGGRTTVRALASVAGWEHERLSERTRKGLAAARDARRATSGAATPDWAAIRKRIATMRADGMSLQAIADVLNEEGVPTQRGGAKWRKSSVQTAAGYKRRSRSTVDGLPAVERRRPRPPATPPEAP